METTAPETKPIEKKAGADPLKEAEARFNSTKVEETIVPPASHAAPETKPTAEPKKKEEPEEIEPSFTEDDLIFQKQFLYDIGKGADFLIAGIHTGIYNKTVKNRFVELKDVRLDKTQLERKIDSIPPRYRDKIIKSMPPWLWFTLSIEAEYVQNIAENSKKKT